MTIEQLRYFCSVAQFKNITRAADALYISSSAMSRHIISLEESLGVQLLIRGGRSIELTPAGQYILDRAPALISAFDGFQDSIRQIHNQHTSTIIIACPSMYQKDLFDAYRRFSDKHLEYKLMLNPMRTWEIPGAVTNNEADIGITYDFELNSCDESQFHSVPILNDQFALLVNNDNALAKSEYVTLKDFSGQPFLAARRPFDPNSEFLARVGRQNNHSQTSYSLDNPAKTVMQVKAGFGITIYPKMICDEYKLGCSVVSINEEDAKTNLVAITQKNHNNEGISHLLNELVALCKSDNNSLW